jgi:multicomponent K+:H+ antiporter subunit E
MRFIFPMPTTTFVLFIVWLLLNQSVAPGHLVLAALFAITIPWLVSGLQEDQSRIRRPFKAVFFLLKVFYDIVTANIQVAIQVIGPIRFLQPGFIAVPLDIKGDFPITVLASTISLTPGTLSAEISEDKAWLYVHALHLKDETATIREIKKRYEAPLMEIFGC